MLRGWIDDGEPAKEKEHQGGRRKTKGSQLGNVYQGEE